MAANALPGVLHAIAQRRPTAHFRAGDDTAELKDPTAAARSSISRVAKYPSTRTKSFTISWVLSYQLSKLAYA